jgi:hypothetical protein
MSVFDTLSGTSCLILHAGRKAMAPSSSLSQITKQRSAGSAGTLAAAIPAPSRAVVILAVVLLSACAASYKPDERSAPEPPAPYPVGGSIGLLVTPRVTPVGVWMQSEETAASVEATAEAKRREVQRGVGVTALTILTAPLAIFTPMYPPAMKLAVLPFKAADATAKASQEADRLKDKAVQARRELACAQQLSAAHPEVPEAFQRALADDSLRRTIEAEVRDTLYGRARVPITLVDAGRDEGGGSEPVPFLEQATQSQLQTVVELEIRSLDLTAEAAGDDPASCRYTVIVNADVNWWDVAKRLIAYQSEALWLTRLKLDAFDLPALLDRSEELRFRVARGLRDAVAGTFDVPALKFADRQAQP